MKFQRPIRRTSIPLVRLCLQADAGHTHHTTHTLMEINTVANDMYFIINGQVEQSMLEADGSEVIERKVGPGGVVGVLAAYFGIRYIYTTRSATPCFCLRLTRNQLLPLLKVR